MLLVHEEVAWVLLVLLAGGGFASITFLAEGEIEVITAEANPVPLSRHRCHDEPVTCLFGRRSECFHFEF